MVLLRKLKVVVAFLEFQEKDHLVVADELEARDAEVRVKTTGPSSWARDERACQAP